MTTYFRALRILVVFALLAVAYRPAPAFAQSSTQYCVDGTETYMTGCFATLARAESFMREQTPTYADVLKAKGSQPIDADTTKLLYGVDAQPPRVWLDPVYIAGSWDTRGTCDGGTVGADPRFVYACSSESALVAGYTARYLQDAGTCHFTDIHTVGAYRDPFARIYGDYARPTGYLVLTEQGTDRVLQWTIFCEGWTAPEVRSVSLSKFQSFECRVDFAAQNAIGIGALVFPNICQPSHWLPYIIAKRVKGLGPCGPCEGGRDSLVGAVFAFLRKIIVA